MNLTWTKGKSEDEKNILTQEYIQAYHLRERLEEILEEKIQSCQKAMRDLDKYDQASWPYYQADRLGQIRAYEEIISLFSKKDVTLRP